MRDNFVPDYIKDKPVLDIRLEFYYKSFWRLGSCRDFNGYGATPIKWTAINEMAKHYDLGFGESEDFFEIIESLDSHYLSLENKKNESIKPVENNPVGSKGNLKKLR